MYQNISIALSTLSEEHDVAIALRVMNAVDLLVKLMSHGNEVLQIASATAVSNIRKAHLKEVDGI
jgi:hypothetical protein